MTRAKGRPTRAAEHRALLKAHRQHYAGLLKFQGGGCAICGRPPANRKLDLDHDHRSMVVRGLLCVRCNRNCPDWVTPAWLRACADYLEQPPMVKFLVAKESVLKEFHLPNLYPQEYPKESA